MFGLIREYFGAAGIGFKIGFLVPVVVGVIGYFGYLNVKLYYLKSRLRTAEGLVRIYRQDVDRLKLRLKTVTVQYQENLNYYKN